MLLQPWPITWELLTRSDGSSPDAGKELGYGIRDNELNSLPPLGIPSSFGKTLNSFKHLAAVRQRRRPLMRGLMRSHWAGPKRKGTTGGLAPGRRRVADKPRHVASIVTAVVVGSVRLILTTYLLSNILVLLPYCNLKISQMKLVRDLYL